MPVKLQTDMARTKHSVFVILTSVGIAVGLSGLLVLIVLFAVSMKDHQKYSVVLDAGSSSTKLNLFTWKANMFRTNAEIKLVSTLKQDPGISAYVGEPSKAYQKLIPDLSTLTANLTSDEKSKTPVYLAATAGMRLKLLEDPLGSMEVFEVMRRGLTKSEINVETPNERIRMLSGAEEGLYGWVSVNNILGLITASKQEEPTSTIGSLDLGGASTQISFVPGSKAPDEAAGVNYYPIKLFDKAYEVYSYSFLCYGKNEFENRLFAALVERAGASASSINHPCFLNGYSAENLKISPSQCVTGPFAAKSFRNRLTEPLSTTSYRLVGTGNAAECKGIINEQFPTTTCARGSCSFNNVFQPPVRGDFRAYSGFSFAMNYFFKDKVTGFTRTEVEGVVETYCGRSTTMNYTNPGAKFAEKYCFDGFYLLALLENLGFKNDDTFRRITFGNKIEKQTVSWASGYMLDQSGQLRIESTQIYLPVAVFASLTVIFIILLVVSIVGLVYAIRQIHGLFHTYQ